jgi:hypothetical protein
MEKRKMHGLTKHPLYKKWADMKKRCYNKNVDRYKNYGALGIEVCEEWKNNFFSFYNWSIENGWKEGLTIERKDNYGNYCPENCKYIPFNEQAYNKKNTFYVNIDGVKYCLIELLKKQERENRFSTIWHGIKKGKTIEYYVKKYKINISNTSNTNNIGITSNKFVI